MHTYMYVWVRSELTNLWDLPSTFPSQPYYPIPKVHVYKPQPIGGLVPSAYETTMDNAAAG